MSPERKKMYKKLGILLGITVVLSLYVAGLLQTLISGYGFSSNPIIILQCMIANGFPTGTFFLFLFVLGFTMVYALFHQLKSTEGMDKMGRLFKLSVKRKGYGDTHFEEPGEYEKAALVQSADDAVGTILGQLDDSGKKIINFRMDKENRLNQHMAVVGASGSGKTYTFSKPYCFQTVKRRESIILTDPDGGLYRDMAGYFKDNGYVVRRLDLNNLNKSDGWHCVKAIKGDELNAQLFAQTCISNAIDKPESIYGTGPMSLLKALILKVALSDHFEPKDKNIESVYQLIQHPDGEVFLDTMFDPASLTPKERPCLKPYLAFKQGSPNLRGNLITNLAVMLQLLQNELVCKVLSQDDIDLELPAKQPCAYFCIFPDSHDTFKFIVSLFFSMLFVTLVSYADNQPNGRCPIPINFLLDEFASIGTLPDFDRKMATIRKRGLNVAMIFQDMTQLQNNYKDSWVTLLSNCSTFLSLGINDQYTADWTTKRIGETTIEVQTQQHKAMESIFTIFRSHSSGEGKRALLSYDELFKLSENDSIILFQWHNPIWARKYPFVLHPESKKLRTILPTDIPDITNVSERQRIRDEENAYIEAYLAKHPLNKVDRSYTDASASLSNTIDVKTIAYTVIKATKRLYSWIAERVLEIRKRDSKSDMSFDFEEEFSFEINEGPSESSSFVEEVRGASIPRISLFAENDSFEVISFEEAPESAHGAKNEPDDIIVGFEDKAPIEEKDQLQGVRDNRPIPNHLTADNRKAVASIKRFNAGITSDSCATHSNLPPAKYKHD